LQIDDKINITQRVQDVRLASTIGRPLDLDRPDAGPGSAHQL
jgi:hypothetical protein